MGTSSTLWLAIMACTVGLSVGLPRALDLALKILADTDLDLKGFYTALETHDFKKAGELYDRMRTNQENLKKEAKAIATLKTRAGLATERFMRLAEVQMKVLVERVGAILNNEKDDVDKKPVKPVYKIKPWSPPFFPAKKVKPVGKKGNKKASNLE